MPSMCLNSGRQIIVTSDHSSKQKFALVFFINLPVGLVGFGLMVVVFVLRSNSERNVSVMSSKRSI